MKRDEFYIPSLNGLRAVSILLVVIHHLSIQQNIFGDLGDVLFLRPVLDFIQDGHMGVNVFFVISGFLITWLMLNEEITTGHVSLKHFYIRRSLRIFPAYYFLLMIYYTLQVCGFFTIDNMSWLATIFYMKDFHQTSDWYTAHAWSLSVEEKFYLLWPIIFTAGNTVRKRAVWILILLSPVARTYIYFYPNSWIGDMNFFTRIDAIAFGCALAFYKDAVLEFLRSRWNMVIWSSAFMLIVLRYLPDFAARLGIEFIFVPLGVTHGTLANALIALIVLYSVYAQRGLWFKFLNLKVLDYVGRLSYSIYLWQQIFIVSSGYWWQQYPANLPLIAGASLLSYYMVEQPLLRMKLRFKKISPPRVERDLLN